MEEILDQELDNSNRPVVFSTKGLIIWIAIIIFSIVFQIMPRLFQGYTFLLGTGGLLAFNVHALIVLKGENKLNVLLSVLCIIWTAYIIWGMISNGGYPFNRIGIIAYLLFFTITFIIYQVVFRKNLRMMSK